MFQCTETLIQGNMLFEMSNIHTMATDRLSHYSLTPYWCVSVRSTDTAITTSNTSRGVIPPPPHTHRLSTNPHKWLHQLTAVSSLHQISDHLAASHFSHHKSLALNLPTSTSGQIKRYGTHTSELSIYDQVATILILSRLSVWHINR